MLVVMILAPFARRSIVCEIIRGSLSEIVLAEFACTTEDGIVACWNNQRNGSRMRSVDDLNVDHCKDHCHPGKATNATMQALSHGPYSDFTAPNT